MRLTRYTGYLLRTLIYLGLHEPLSSSIAEIARLRHLGKSPHQGGASARSPGSDPHHPRPRWRPATWQASWRGRQADTQERAIISDRLSEADRAFIAERDMLFLSTVNATGQPPVSYKSGAPGFVRVHADDLLLPCYNGNGMFLSVGNVTWGAAWASSSSTSRQVGVCGGMGLPAWMRPCRSRAQPLSCGSVQGRSS